MIVVEAVAIKVQSSHILSEEYADFFLMSFQVLFFSPDEKTGPLKGPVQAITRFSFCLLW